MAATEDVWMPREVHNYDIDSTYLNECECYCWSGSLGIVKSVGVKQGCVPDAFSDASKKFRLKINIKKTEVLYQPNSTRTREEDIMVDGKKLNSDLGFTYLEDTISSNGRICPCGLKARYTSQS